MMLALTAIPTATAGDSLLVDRCRHGEAAAWHELYSAHFQFGWRVARRLGAAESEVEDVVHEAFEIAFRKMDQFESGRFSTWLYRIIANLVSSKLERDRLRSLLSSLWGGSERHGDSHESTVDARLTLDKLEGVLRSLPRAKREVFALRELEGLSHDEISEMTGVKVETVRSRLHSARTDFEKVARKRGLIP
jgi:RNA polymerase sigma-70 factor (ECF subfamily)